MLKRAVRLMVLTAAGFMGPMTRLGCRTAAFRTAPGSSLSRPLRSECGYSRWGGQEDKLLEFAGAHLAVLAEVNGGLGEAVGLAAGVEAEHVRFFFLDAGLRVQDRREHEEQDAGLQHDQGQDGRIADVVNLPAVAPAPQRPLQSEEQVDERQHIDDGDEQNVFGDVVEDVVTHFVAHDGLNFLG